jgi:hypothetical protein
MKWEKDEKTGDFECVVFGEELFCAKKTYYAVDLQHSWLCYLVSDGEIIWHPSPNNFNSDKAAKEKCRQHMTKMQTAIRKQLNHAKRNGNRA